MTTLRAGYLETVTQQTQTTITELYHVLVIYILTLMILDFGETVLKMSKNVISDLIILSITAAVLQSQFN